FLKKELLRTHNMYLLEEENDILFVGSSHVFATIDIDYIEQKTNSNAFLLATPSQNISQSYHLIKEFLNHKTPKVIFLETYSLKEYAGGDFESHAAYDGMRLSKTKVEAAYDASFNDSIKDLYSFTNLLIPFYKYHDRWNGELTEQDFKYFQNATLNKGSEIPPVNSEFTPTDFLDYTLSKITEKTALSANIEKRLNDIIAMCDERQIKLVLFSTPYLAHSGYSLENQRKNINYLKDKLNNSAINYLDFNLLYEEININYTDFVDNHHLNYKGAQKVNKYLGDWIVSNYKSDLPNRESEGLVYKYFNKMLTDEIVLQKETHFQTQDSIFIENIAILKKSNDYYIIVDLNDDLNLTKFNEAVYVDSFMMMVHLYPEEKDLDKIPSKLDFLNHDFKPNVLDINGNKFLFSKLENKTTSEISFYKYANFTFYSNSKGRGNVLTLFDLDLK
ncbi:MAG: hypothetical protein KDC67_14565, partial [Ignavibacteriae bacterium]|nr:hypothetical protein [Ignavibacteriota bacterium]